jgi:hypothetical protein
MTPPFLDPVRWRASTAIRWAIWRAWRAMPRAAGRDDGGDMLLAFAVARLFPNLLSNALEPGWVPTITGGPSAPNDSSAAMPATSAVA